MRSLGTSVPNMAARCNNCTMPAEDGLAQLVSSYGSDKSSSEDDQLEEIQCKTDQCDKIKTKDLKDSVNFYDNIAEAR